jgi:hypothetical protein
MSSKIILSAQYDSIDTLLPSFRHDIWQSADIRTGTLYVMGVSSERVMITEKENASRFGINHHPCATIGINWEITACLSQRVGTLVNLMPFSISHRHDSF